MRFFGGALITTAESDRVAVVAKLLEAIRSMEASNTTTQPIQVEEGDRPLVLYDLRSVMMSMVGRGVDPGDANEDLCSLITGSVGPLKWTRNGGNEAVLRIFPSGVCIIRAPSATHAEVATLLKQVRAARTPTDHAGDASDAASPQAATGPRAFSADELNRLTVRLNETLLVHGLRALARREELVAPAAEVTAAVDESVTVVARFTEINAELERALAALDIKIESRASTASAGVLILLVPSERIIDLGLLAATRRVELLPESAMTSQ